MELTPSEQDRLLIFNVAQLAQARRARGVKLNKPEAVSRFNADQKPLEVLRDVLTELSDILSHPEI